MSLLSNSHIKASMVLTIYIRAVDFCCVTKCRAVDFLMKADHLFIHNYIISLLNIIFRLILTDEALTHVQLLVCLNP